MQVIIKGNMLVITTEAKTIYFDLSRNIGNKLKHEIELETICMNKENSETNEPHKFKMYLFITLGKT